MYKTVKMQLNTLAHMRYSINGKSIKPELDYSRQISYFALEINLSDLHLQPGRLKPTTALKR